MKEIFQNMPILKASRGFLHPFEAFLDCAVHDFLSI